MINCLKQFKVLWVFRFDQPFFSDETHGFRFHIQSVLKQKLCLINFFFLFTAHFWHFFTFDFSWSFQRNKKNHDILIISVFWFFTQWVRNLVVYFAPKLLKWKLCQKNHTYQTLMNLDEKKLNMQLTQSSYILHFYYDYLVDVFSMQIYPSECFLITFKSKKNKNETNFYS